MILFNASTKTPISKNFKIARTLLENACGLLNEKFGTALLFNTRFGIHTFFMQYPIDVLILDQDNQVVQIKKNLPPNRVFFWNPKYSTIIELPTNSHLTVTVGNTLKFTSPA